MNSIQEIKYDSGNIERDPVVRIEYCNEREIRMMFVVLNCAESNMYVGRRGFKIKLKGSCFKAPQGINWKVKIEFECQKDAEEFLKRYKSLCGTT